MFKHTFILGMEISQQLLPKVKTRMFLFELRFPLKQIEVMLQNASRLSLRVLSLTQGNHPD